MQTPENLRYSAEHEWVVADGDRARVGITDYAQDALGDIVYVQLPATGTAVIAGATCAEIESTKSVSDIYAPVSGTVVECNDALGSAPEEVNRDPYAAGWLFVIEMSQPSELDSLMDAAGYQAFTLDL